MGRWARWIAVAVVATAGLWSGAGWRSDGGTAAAVACQTFPVTGFQVCDPFLTYWQQNGGLAQQGYPISAEFDEVNPSDGKTYRTQYFERARFEYHPEQADPRYQVLLGLLGTEQYRARYPDAPPPPFPGDPFNNPAYPRECADFAQTGQRVCSLFLAYWQANGGLAQQGLPLTGVILETNPTDGKTYPTQYFERARFEFHEEIADPRYKVLLGLLGREQFAARYHYGLPIARDDFADPASGWTVTQEQAGTIEYADGGLRLAVARPNVALVATSSALPAPNDVVVEVSARKLGGPDSDTFGFGLACRVQDARNFYLLEINGGGLAGIVKVQDGRVVLLQTSGGVPVTAVRTGNAANRLVARCVGDTLALTVNGQTIATARDATFGAGRVGVVAGAYDQPGLTVVFDDLALYRP